MDGSTSIQLGSVSQLGLTNASFTFVTWIKINSNVNGTIMGSGRDDDRVVLGLIQGAPFLQFGNTVRVQHTAQLPVSELSQVTWRYSDAKQEVALFVGSVAHVEAVDIVRSFGDVDGIVLLGALPIGLQTTPTEGVTILQCACLLSVCLPVPSDSAQFALVCLFVPSLFSVCSQCACLCPVILLSMPVLAQSVFSLFSVCFQFVPMCLSAFTLSLSLLIVIVLTRVHSD